MASTPSAPQPASSAFDDFGLGIFDDSPQSAATSPAAPTRQPREDAVAQSSQAADQVLPRAAQPSFPAKSRVLDEDLVWLNDDDSDVRLVPTESVCETSAIPAAETADESEELSDVTEMDEDVAPRRRRRRRRGKPEGTVEGEGTTFDLNEVLDESGETPDFISASSTSDSSLADEASDDSEMAAPGSEADDERPQEYRGRRRRRRGRRPDVAGSGAARESASATEGSPPADVEGVLTSDADDVDEDEDVPVITYAKMPSWEEAIRFLLNPHLVGKNLDSESEDESLDDDPRGSGGSEPTPALPPPRRYRRSGAGRGRRP